MMTVEQAQSMLEIIRCYGRVKNVGKKDLSVVLIGNDLISCPMQIMKPDESMMYGLNAQGIIRLLQSGAVIGSGTGADGKPIMIFDWTVEYK